MCGQRAAAEHEAASDDDSLVSQPGLVSASILAGKEQHVLQLRLVF